MAAHPEWIVTPEELKAELNGELSAESRAPILLDVREPEEFAESRLAVPGVAGGGVKLIPLGELMVRVERELPEKSADIVIYCAHGVRSMHALMGMARLGYTRLRSLEGGICAWQELGYPSG